MPRTNLDNLDTGVVDRLLPQDTLTKSVVFCKSVLQLSMLDDLRGEREPGHRVAMPQVRRLLEYVLAFFEQRSENPENRR